MRKLQTSRMGVKVGSPQVICPDSQSNPLHTVVTMDTSEDSEASLPIGVLPAGRCGTSPDEPVRFSRERSKRTEERLSQRLASVDEDATPLHPQSALGKELHGARIDPVFLFENARGQRVRCVVVQNRNCRL